VRIHAVKGIQNTVPGSGSAEHVQPDADTYRIPAVPCVVYMVIDPGQEVAAESGL
jgi:hypothetical protein